MKQELTQKLKTICRLTLMVSVVAMMATLWSSNGMAGTAREIDVSVDVALERFYQQVEGAKEFMGASKGMLIMPNVTKGAFFFGAEWGEGALRTGGITIDYYGIAAGSIGLQIGAEKKDIFLLFMTDAALQSFRASNGWEAGVDGNIALINVGAGGRGDTTTIKDPIVGFVLDVKGLMADISLKGSKFTKLDKSP
jgi:lipid-binding SYLF domain-containing protein